MGVRRIDHIGIVAPSWDEARALLVERFGLVVADDRGAGERGVYFPPERTMNYFLRVGEGETLIEVLVPVDASSGTARFLAKRGPGLHHIGYAVDDVRAEAERLRAAGFTEIDIGRNADAAFFHPKSVLGILTELVPAANPDARLHRPRAGR